MKSFLVDSLQALQLVDALVKKRYTQIKSKIAKKIDDDTLQSLLNELSGLLARGQVILQTLSSKYNTRMGFAIGGDESSEP